jgi:hypothetical protein
MKEEKISEESPKDEKDIEITEPIIINLGKQKRKRIKKLLKGRGRLLDEVEDVVDEVTLLLDEELDGKVVVPLILVYQKKAKKKKYRGIFGL